MKIKDVECAVINFCAKENISIVNGFIDPKHLNKIEVFLDVLKVSTKSRAKFIRHEPKIIGNIIANLKISGKSLHGPQSDPVKALHPKDCPECFGNGLIYPQGGGKAVTCWRKYD